MNPHPALLADDPIWLILIKVVACSRSAWCSRCS